MVDKKCAECGVKLIKPHCNQKKCPKCRAYLNKYPKSTMTKEQIKRARALIGIKNRHEIAEEIGVSLSNLKRAFRGVRFPRLSEYSSDVIEKVCSYYEKHGKNKTQEKFKNVNVRAIVERHNDKFKPRQVRWTDKELIELARMAGLISFAGQAKYFNRPRANDGSIWSVWVKKFHLGSGTLNGLQLNTSKYICTADCPTLKVKLLKRRDPRKISNIENRYIRLWVDLENHLKPEIAPYLKEAIKAMAKYQRWLFNSKNPKRKILKMIREREVKGMR